MSDKVEYVYILTNPAMPEFVKVGITNNIERRKKDLYKKTCVPLPFECFAHIVVKPTSKVSAATLEKNLHKLLSKSITQNKEFFRTSTSEVLEFFQSFVETNPALELVMGDGKSKKAKKRNAPTTFEMLQIQEGAELVYKSDSSIRCKVVNDKNTVLYNGEHTTLSAIAMKQNGGKPVNGFDLFIYSASDHPNETLSERRVRLESGQ